MSLDVYLKDPTATYEVEYLYESNITHNLTEMAEHAEIYLHLWSPDQIGISNAKYLITGLKRGLDSLKENPEYFDKLNPKNGWGNRENLVSFVEDYLNACIKYPESIIVISK